MGEYINYKGQEVKLGTCEDLYYTNLAAFKQAVELGEIKPSIAKPYLEDNACRFRRRANALRR